MANFTLTDIGGALSRLLDVPPGHPALARYAGQLEMFVNSNAELKRSGLGGSGFQTIALSNLPPEIRDLMDPAKLQEMQRRQAENANPSSAETTAFGKFAAFARGDLSAQGGSERGASSASYGRELLTGDMAKARDLALSSGMDWIANNPDLLRLGPSAVQALADVQLRQDSYQRFKNIGLEAKTIVDGARYFTQTLYLDMPSFYEWRNEQYKQRASKQKKRPT